MKILYTLLIFIPISIVANLMHVDGTVIFLLSALSIVGLAAVLGKATEDAAYYLGQRAGGFLNATLGNSAELLINVFALKAGLLDVVKSSIIGSIIGNILLVLGLSLLCGGLKHKVQTFNIKAVELNSSMLFFAVIGMSIPALFIHTMDDDGTKVEELSLVIAAIMFILYLLQIVFTFFTHKEAFESAQEEEMEKPSWSLKTSIIVLVVVTCFLALESEMFTGSVESITETFGLSQMFVGLILIPIIGNAAEHSTAVVMAVKNKMDVAIEVSVGSTLQVILFVMPALVFISLIWTPMNLIFTPFELVVLVCSALITNRIIEDGRSNWIEGFQLLAIYAIIAISFFIV
ncbi:MAG: calcium/proton exchanger [Lachnospiraceae bacterium]|nr:calcium/proton exchanger [Lachnospiraceae bacterium]